MNALTPRTAAAFPADALRARFPALSRARGFVFFDNAAGAQVPEQVLEAVNTHLIEHNVQRGGRYRHSRAVDAMITGARAAVAAFVNARRPEEISFGMNATSFIRLVSLAVGQGLAARNEIVVSELDHEANVATWLALEAMGARIRWWLPRADGVLHAEDLAPLLSARTRLVACALASNALGSITDVRAAAALTHEAGGEIFLDAVHYAPHAPIDVQALGCDYLVCSGYKIFAPHMGFMWGRYEALARLPTFREEFIPDEPPGKIEAGTFTFENVAGMAAAVAYLGALGQALTGVSGAPPAQRLGADVRVAMDAVRAYEQSLSGELLSVLADAGAHVYGVTDPARLDERVPTVAFNLPGVAPQSVSEAAARAEIGIRDGHMYAPRLMRRLGLDPETGVVRVSLVHYNTVAEIARLGEVLRGLSRGRAS
ncbi:MAG TPA: cysteine desulfurase-like protein [Steroidobacteraceae bacterium]|nr:cysteine desulfurase-like protein [Steroidobacteraceae bacterium]